MRRHSILWLFPLLLLLAGCEPPPPAPRPPTPTAEAQSIVVGVARSALPLLERAADGYAEQTDRDRPRLLAANSASLWPDLDAGQIDALITPVIPPDRDNWFNPIALDGLLIVVHPDNPVANVSRAQVQALYNGRLTTWQAVGGSDVAVTLVSREAGSAARAFFRERLMAEQRVTINAVVAPGPDAVRTAVATDPGAIGYLMAGNDLSGVRPLAIDGSVASPATLADQSYPLTTPLYFLMPGTAEPDGLLRDWLAWLQSDAGQHFLGDQYGRVR